MQNTLSKKIYCNSTKPYPKVSFVIEYNPQNSEMNFSWKYEGDMLKIIIIMMGYTLNNFITHMTISY
jgi:hypothetical protein